MKDPNGANSRPDFEALFGLDEGRFSQGLERMQLARGARLRAGRLAIILASAAWFPLLVLAAFEGVAWGDRVDVPLLSDFLPYGQLLISIPVLIVGELSLARILYRAVAELRRSEVLSGDDRQALDADLATIANLWRGRRLNLVLLMLTCLATVFSLLEAREWLTGGWQVSANGMTLAGWWYLLISLPMMRFLALRWLWRLMLWAFALWKLSRRDLQPRPAHPDRAGGLAFLGGTQSVFGILVFSFGVQLSCLIADAVSFRGADLMDFRGELVAFVVLVVLVLLLPLMVFAPTMIRAREEHLLFLSESAHRGAGDLERKLRASKRKEPSRGPCCNERSDMKLGGRLL